MTQTSLFNFENKGEEKLIEEGLTCPAYWCEACLEISKFKHNPEFCDKHDN